jgi:hypothetical protein
MRKSEASLLRINFRTHLSISESFQKLGIIYESDHRSKKRLPDTRDEAGGRR